MAFASIFIPNFMVQAVVRAEPALRERAVALVEGTSSTRTVIGLNAAAKKVGVQLGMTKTQAQQFGEIEIRERSHIQESIAHAALLDLGWSLSPRVEDTAADTLVLDLAGLACLFGSEKNIAQQLAEGAARLGFTTHIATASNLDAAILASRAFMGITVIPAGEESTMIGKVPACALAPSAEILETLERWGIRTCAALAALPVLQLSERLGQEGVRLHELARAGSTRAMVLAQPAIYFEEVMELEEAVEELEPLSFLLGRLLGQLCARLKERALAAGLLRVRFELEPSSERQVRLLEEIPCPHPALSIYEKTLNLALPMSDSRMLLKLLILNLQADAPSAPVVKITLAAEAARPRVVQGGLFSPISPDLQKVELTLARLAKLVGAASIGSPELLDTHRPEGFRMLRFFPHSDLEDARRAIRGSPGRKDVGLKASDTPVVASDRSAVARDCKTVLRVFRPALPATVDVREGCPARVTFPGIRGRVMAASGPWRGSGDWWSEDAWQSDEWDIEIHFDFPLQARSPGPTANSSVNENPQGNVYRMFYDFTRQQWFVRGVYD